jgi:hypothetical protein
MGAAGHMPDGITMRYENSVKGGRSCLKNALARSEVSDLEFCGGLKDGELSLAAQVAVRGTHPLTG